MNDDVLVMEDVYRRFGDVTVLRGVTAAVPRGQIAAFVGPNGSGKTTLFHTISGNLTPDRGRIRFLGKPIQGLPPWRIARMGLGTLFQDVRVFGNLSVLENMLLALHDRRHQSVIGSLLRGSGGSRLGAALVRDAERWLDVAGLDLPLDKPARTLSFGNQKLLALARLMAGRYSFLLIDEPTSGIAGRLAQQVGTLLTRMREQGTTIALIEHNLSLVAETADTVFVMQDGRIRDHGSADTILAKPEIMEICIGLAAPPPASQRRLDPEAAESGA